MRWRRRRPARPPPVLDLGDGDAISLEDTHAGVLVTGAPGSGKTSAVAGRLTCGLHAHPARPSVVICPAKGSDLAQHRRWHALAGSPLPFLVFGAETGHAFNWLEYAVKGPGGVNAAVPMLQALQGLLTRNQPAGGDAYFLPQGLMHLTEAVRACWLGNKRVCVRDAHKFLASAAARVEELHAPGFAADTLHRLKDVPGREADHCLDYWAESWLRTCASEKTAACIRSVAEQVVHPLMTGPVGDTLSGPDTTFSPGDLEAGAVLYLNYPVLHGFESYKLALAIWMMCLNRYALSRPGGRPLAAIQDEYPQTALEGEDARIAATGRSHGLSYVRVIQALPQLASCMGGGDRGRQEAMGILACHGHIIACANGCRETNEHFAGGQGMEMETVFSGSSDGGAEPFDPVRHALGLWQPRANVSFGPQLLPVLKPQEFLTLRTGGARNGYVCDALVFTANRTFANGRAFKRVSFQQVL